MLNINCEKCGKVMKIIDEDSRQEWYEATHVCEKCDITKIHRREFDQYGRVISDEIKDGKNG